MAAFNPRFPYTLKVLRAVMDENGEPVLDENANPVYCTIPFDVVEYDKRLPKMPVNKEGYGTVVPDEEEIYAVTGERIGNRVPVIHNLVNIPFGYRQQTANAVINGDVIIAEMKIACPVILGEILTKDLLEMTDYDRTFRAEVVKKSNTNFGSNIWYNEVKQ